MKKILVVDGNSIINRAYYGVKPLTTRQGKHTNAVFGALNIILKQVNTLKPDFAAVAFDLKAPTFRHKMYADYKAGRKKADPELLEQFPYLKDCLRLFGISVLELEGYEADDIQGTVASFARQDESLESYILSGDRDLFQLIDDRITVLYPSVHETVAYHKEQFFEKYGVTPDRFVDMKAIMGDKSDNIPGVRGIGDKGAAALITEFGTLDGIYENINSEKITKGTRQKLLDCREDAYLSRELARIMTDVPLGLTLEDLAVRPMDRGGLYKKLTELELNSFITKLGLSAKDVITEAPAPKSEPAVRQDDEKKTGADEPAGEPLPSYDRMKSEPITRDELDRLRCERVALALVGDDAYLCTGERAFVYSDDLSLLADALSDARELVLYDAKTLLHALDKRGAEFTRIPKFCDLMLYAYVKNPGGACATLDTLAMNYLGVPAEASDPCHDLLLPLEKIMRDELEKDGLTRVLDELELPLIPVLFECERVGFKINVSGMRDFAEALDKLANELKERIYIQALGEFNINSPKQLGEVLFVKLGLPCKKKKNKNGFSTDAETLEELRQYSPIIDDILEYRQVTKLHGTYANALPRLVDENDRIHTDFKQALTATGRLSSADPNLQNIPIRTAMGREMRRYFIAREGYTLVDADYSQIELRLLSHMSDDYNMKNAFIHNEDIHRKTAAAVFSIPEEFVTDDMRKRAKAVNFGIVYGISGFSLAKDIGTTSAEATRYIKNYLMNYPGIDSYLERVVEDARVNGYTVTEFGRRRYIPELRAANGMQRQLGKRIAMNAPIQGTAADVMKLAMIRVYERLKRDVPDAKIVMQVHDELVVECPDSDRELVAGILKEEMERAVKLSVPLTVDVTSGKNWLQQS
ncbi:MAG: DNA polymerase I [Clostridia bacterium]|nr:DNA polymerase I [Clostridia bacterium]